MSTTTQPLVPQYGSEKALGGRRALKRQHCLCMDVPLLQLLHAPPLLLPPCAALTSINFVMMRGMHLPCRSCLQAAQSRCSK